MHPRQLGFRGLPSDRQALRMNQNAETYRQFTAAWAARDVDALMALVTDDIIYGASVGPEPGTTFVGRNAVRAGFGQMLEHDDVTEVEAIRVDHLEDRAYAQWRFALADGSEVRGIDVIEFRAGKISVKQGFRKTKG